jgi:GntR family transcriptional regulator
VPERIAPRLLRTDLAQPLHALVERLYNVEAVEADEIMEFIVADEFRASMLNVDVGHPLILVERIVFADNGEALECSRAYYRADRFRLQHRLRKSPNGGRSHQAVPTAVPSPPVEV